MPSKKLFCAAALLTLAGFCSVCAAEGNSPARFALVIGNAAYSSKPLANPKSDAALMAQSLTELGFVVTKAINLDRSGLYKSVRGFVDQLPEGSVAMLYYAGHGMQINGSNYLIPVDMTPTGERDVAARAFPVKAIMENLELGKSVVNLVVLDACRNNPFLPPSPSKYRGFDGLGLTRVVAPKGTLIAYSTSPGQLAEDGQGRKNSLYTEVLAEKLKAPGQTAEGIFKAVADAVRKRTYDDQQPWYETSLVDDFYFIPPEGVQMIAAKRNEMSLVAAKSTSTRGIESSGEWYMTLNNREWDQLHNEIELRVQKMIEDDFPRLEHNATSGNVVAQTTLGIAYREGIQKPLASATASRFRFLLPAPATHRSEADNANSVKWLKSAAESGFPIAQYELSRMYYSGRGVDVNKQQSKHWLELAARANYIRANHNLIGLKRELGGADAPTIKDLSGMKQRLEGWSTEPKPEVSK